MPTVPPTQFRPPAQQSPYAVGTYRPAANPQKRVNVGNTPISYTTPQAPRVQPMGTVPQSQPYVTPKPVTPAVQAFNTFQAQQNTQGAPQTYTPPTYQPSVNTPPPMGQTPVATVPVGPAVRPFTPPAGTMPLTPVAPAPTASQTYSPPQVARPDATEFARWRSSPEYLALATSQGMHAPGWDDYYYQQWRQRGQAAAGTPAAPTTPSPSPTMPPPSPVRYAPVSNEDAIRNTADFREWNNSRKYGLGWTNAPETTPDQDLQMYQAYLRSPERQAQEGMFGGFGGGGVTRPLYRAASDPMGPQHRWVGDTMRVIRR